MFRKFERYKVFHGDYKPRKECRYILDPALNMRKGGFKQNRKYHDWHTDKRHKRSYDQRYNIDNILKTKRRILNLG